MNKKADLRLTRRLYKTRLRNYFSACDHYDPFCYALELRMIFQIDRINGVKMNIRILQQEIGGLDGVRLDCVCTKYSQSVAKQIFKLQGRKVKLVFSCSAKKMTVVAILTCTLSYISGHFFVSFILANRLSLSPMNDNSKLNIELFGIRVVVKEWMQLYYLKTECIFHVVVEQSNPMILTTIATTHLAQVWDSVPKKVTVIIGKTNRLEAMAMCTFSRGVLRMNIDKEEKFL